MEEQEQKIGGPNMEAIAIIHLMGAQIIAEFIQSGNRH